MALKIWVTTPFFYPDMSVPWSAVLNDMLAIVDAAEELGFEGVAVNENHFQNYVTNPSALAFSAVAAARTRRLRIIPGVVVLPYYHPLLIASEMAFLDHLAPGRIGIGVARGGSRYPLDRLGIDPANSRAIYEESLEVIQRVWTENDVEYDGTFFSFPPTTIVPRPATQPHPQIWVGAQSVEGVTRVALQGLNLLTAPNYGTFEPHGDLEALLGAYDAAVAASGKPRGEVMVYRHTWVGRTEAEAMSAYDYIVDEWNHYMALVMGSGSTTTKEERLAARGVGAKPDEYIVGGYCRPLKQDAPSGDLAEKYDDPVLTTPDRMIERFRSYETMGVDHVACLIALGQPIKEIIGQMELMAAEVLPAFAEEGSPA